ncbi:hypothetical protein HPB47_017906, partial [Ixodes persulcatus]
LLALKVVGIAGWCYLEEDSALCHVICDGDYQLCFAAKSGVFIGGINEPWAMSSCNVETRTPTKAGERHSGFGAWNRRHVGSTAYHFPTVHA